MTICQRARFTVFDLYALIEPDYVLLTQKEFETCDQDANYPTIIEAWI